jgi:ATP/maltotriose-dependent transcriptional regulator MalT
MGRVTGLSAEDLAPEADRFGVSDEQVRRDHGISHVLAVAERVRGRGDLLRWDGIEPDSPASRPPQRGHRPLATTPRTELADRLTQAISSRLLRTLGRVSWNPGFASHNDVQPSIPPRELEVLGLIAQGRSNAGISIAMRHTHGGSRWGSSLARLFELDNQVENGQ